MAIFKDLLTSSGEGLLKVFYRLSTEARGESAPLARTYARQLGLSYEQLVCALGFNSAIRDLPDVTAVIGFETYDDLAQERNQIFTRDIYVKVGIKDVLMIYAHVVNDLPMLEIAQHLIKARLEHIENRIEETVNSVLIERYKKEIRAIYSDGAALPELIEDRLSRTDSGFRALLNEVAIIVENRLIPVGDIFYRDSILPEEKRRLITKGLIPRELIESRLGDDDVPEEEREMLEIQLRYMQD